MGRCHGPGASPVVKFGRYDIGAKLYHTPLGYVARAARSDAGGGGGDGGPYAVKVFDPAAMTTLGREAAGRAFLDRARLQKALGAAGCRRWAAVYAVTPVPAAAAAPAEPLIYYVADLYPRSLDTLIDRKVKVSAADLAALAGAVLAGLWEIQRAAGRPHGNLKPANVLVRSRAGPVLFDDVVLTDPAAEEKARQGGETADLYALGRIIYEVVVHRRSKAAAGSWPVQATEHWSGLGRRVGEPWRQLCDRLMHPVPAQRPAGIEAVADEVAKLGRVRIVAPLVRPIGPGAAAAADDEDEDDAPAGVDAGPVEAATPPLPSSGTEPARGEPEGAVEPDHAPGPVADRQEEPAGAAEDPGEFESAEPVAEADEVAQETEPWEEDTRPEWEVWAEQERAAQEEREAPAAREARQVQDAWARKAEEERDMQARAAFDAFAALGTGAEGDAWAAQEAQERAAREAREAEKDWARKAQEEREDWARAARQAFEALKPPAQHEFWVRALEEAREAREAREAQEREEREAREAQEAREREAQEAREREAREAREAQEREARAAQEREAREAQERAVREAQAREAQAREAQAREREAREHQRQQELARQARERQVQVERRRLERKRLAALNRKRFDPEQLE